MKNYQNNFKSRKLSEEKIVREKEVIVSPEEGLIAEKEPVVEKVGKNLFDEDAKTFVTADLELKVRREPDKQAEVMTIVKKGFKMEKINHEDPWNEHIWTKVRFGESVKDDPGLMKDIIGFVMSKFVK